MKEVLILLLVISRIANAQNIGNLIAREEHNIDHNILLVSILYSLAKKSPIILDFRGGQKLKINC